MVAAGATGNIDETSAYEFQGTRMTNAHDCLLWFGHEEPIAGKGADVGRFKDGTAEPGRF
ncbi:hypothetical protein ASG43_09185 [Aureimonas sp. Leaf454]|nr:hypothetical protein ASG43_09185 [Aureimonas sp. Leaf454]